MSVLDVIVISFICRHGALAADDWWMRLPYENNSFNQRAEYGTNASLTCNDSTVPDGLEMLYWIRPDMTVMFGGSNDTFPTLDGPAGWYVDYVTGTMNVVLLQERQFGFYYCVLGNNTTMHVLKKGLNYEEAYFGDLWAKYELNTIIGLSTAGSFFLVCIMLMLICKYHVDDDDYDESDDDKDSTEKSSVNVELSKRATPPHDGSSTNIVQNDVTKNTAFENAAFVDPDDFVSEFFQRDRSNMMKHEDTTEL